MTGTHGNNAGRHRVWPWGGLVSLVVLVSFLPVLTCDFVNWDDDANFVANVAYRGLGPAQMRWMFTAFHNGHYVPLTWVSHGLDYLLWGMAPRGYHLQNLLWHVLSSALVFVLARDLIRRAAPELLRQSGRTVGACLAAGTLAYAIHPLRVESVAWVTERRDVLSGFFYLSTVLLYLRWYDRRRSGAGRWWLGACLASFACSLMAKAWGITLPAVLLILDVYPLGRLRGSGSPGRATGRLVGRKAPFIALALVCGALAFIAQRRSGMYVVADYGLSQRLAQACYGLVFYPWKTVFPFRLSPLYLLDPAFDALSPAVLGRAAAVCAVTALLAWQRKRWPWALVSWLVYAVTVFPVLGVSQSGRQIAADRYGHLALLPIATLTAAGLLRLRLFFSARVSAPRALPVVGAALFSLLCLLGILTWRQTLVWQDSVTLWDQVIRAEPGSYFGYNQRGNVHYAAGDLRRALADYEACLRLNPEFALAYYNRGNIHRVRGDHAQALQDYGEAIRLDSQLAYAYGNRGALRGLGGDQAGALADLDQAIRCNPEYVDAYCNRAQLLRDTGDLAAAVRDCNAALRLEPRRAQAYESRGLLYQGMGLSRQAERDYTAAIRLQPTSASAYTNRGLVRQRRGDLPSALTDYAAAIRADPTAFEAYVNRAGVLSRQGDRDGALRDYRQALECAPAHWPYRGRVEGLIRMLGSAGASP